MANVMLLLGPIAFQEFEVPSGINFGGRQRLALHRLSNGRRIIDTLGRDDAQIRFSGVFSGSDATLRARSLDELRAAGLALPLTWDVFFYTVLISDFHAEYQNGLWIPYQISCTVLRDEASALTESIASFTTDPLTDIGIAAGYAMDAGLGLSPLQMALAVPGATVRSTAAYNVAQSNIADAQSSVAASIDTADAQLADTNIGAATSPYEGVARLLSASDASGQLSSLSAARSFIRRAAINLTNAST